MAYGDTPHSGLYVDVRLKGKDCLRHLTAVKGTAYRALEAYFDVANAGANWSRAKFRDKSKDLSKQEKSIHKAVRSYLGWHRELVNCIKAISKCPLTKSLQKRFKVQLRELETEMAKERFKAKQNA